MWFVHLRLIAGGSGLPFISRRANDEACPARNGGTSGKRHAWKAFESFPISAQQMDL
jgi:hypothetical protein